MCIRYIQVCTVFGTYKCASSTYKCAFGTYKCAFGTYKCVFGTYEPGADSVATGLGQHKFISHGDLDKKQTRNCQFLRDDCLFFKIELK